MSREAVDERREVLAGLIKESRVKVAMLESEIHLYEAQLAAIDFVVEEICGSGAAPDEVDSEQEAAVTQRRNLRNLVLSLVRERAGFTAGYYATEIGNVREGQILNALVHWEGKGELRQGLHDDTWYPVVEPVNGASPEPSEALGKAQADIVRGLFTRAGAAGLGDDVIDSPARKDGLMALIAKGEAAQGTDGRYRLVKQEKSAE